MRVLLRRVAPVVAPATIFAVLLRPAYLAEWYAMRELFRALMSLGVLTPGSNYWGQIHGLNIPTHSWALHALVRTGSLALTFAPLTALCLLLWYLLRIAPPWGIRRRVTLGRAAVLALLASAAIALVKDRVESLVTDWAFRAGEAAGCEYIAISVLWVGPDGPFTGGRWAWLFNALYMHGHWVLAHALAFALAWTAFVVLSRRDPRPRRGQCPRCGYALEGLTRCPECAWGGG